jgi:hypothetical protein
MMTVNGTTSEKGCRLASPEILANEAVGKMLETYPWNPSIEPG